MTEDHIDLYYGSIGIPQVAVLLRAWFLSPLIGRHEVENELAETVREYLGAGDAFSFASARGALAAVLTNVGLRDGDEVIVSGFTCLAVATAVIAAGAKPIYVDIDAATMNVSPFGVIDAIGPRVRAIVIQHTMGSLAEIGPIMAAARKLGIVVIEDCALSIGSFSNGTPVGVNADAAIFSMELSKSISTGWGGILVINNPTLALKFRTWYDRLVPRGLLSISRDVWQIAVSVFLLHRKFYAIGRYLYAIAFKLKLFRYSTPKIEPLGGTKTDFIARLGLPQIKLAIHQWQRLSDVSAASSNYVTLLQSALIEARLKVIGLPSHGVVSVTPRVCFVVKDRKKTIEWFGARSVDVGLWFDGPLAPTATAHLFNYISTFVPNSVQLASMIVNLPCHCGLTSNDIFRLVKLIHEYASEHPEDLCLSN